MPKLFWKHLQKKTLDFCGAVIVGFMLAMTFLVGPMQKEITDLRAQLDDPHHCVSVCADEFEKWGC